MRLSHEHLCAKNAGVLAQHCAWQLLLLLLLLLLDGLLVLILHWHVLLGYRI